MNPVKRMAAAVMRIYFRIGVHLLVVAAGVSGAVAPPRSVEEATDLALRAIWCLFLITGGLSCAWGLWRLSYRPQIVGSLLVAGGVGIYCSVLFGVSGGTVAALLLLAFTQSQISRGIQLRQLDEYGAAGSGGGSPADALLGGLANGWNTGRRFGGYRVRNRPMGEGVGDRSEDSTTGE